MLHLDLCHFKNFLKEKDSFFCPLWYILCKCGSSFLQVLLAAAQNYLFAGIFACTSLLILNFWNPNLKSHMKKTHHANNNHVSNKEEMCVSLKKKRFASRMSCSMPGSQTQRFLCGQSWAFWVGYMEPPEVGQLRRFWLSCCCAATQSYEGTWWYDIHVPGLLLCCWVLHWSHFCGVTCDFGPFTDSDHCVVWLMVGTPRGVHRATCLPCGNGEAEESIQLGLWQRRGVWREGAGVLRATSLCSVL